MTYSNNIIVVIVVITISYHLYSPIVISSTNNDLLRTYCFYMQFILALLFLLSFPEYKTKSSFLKFSSDRGKGT